MPEVCITITDIEAVAVQSAARKRGVTPQAVLRFALQDELASLVRLFRERRRELRHQAIEADPALAATVDAALTEQP